LLINVEGMEGEAMQDEMRMNPHPHAQHIADILHRAQNECRSDIQRVDEPKALALFETVAQVLGGTMKAMHDYSGQTEEIWSVSPGRYASADVTDMAVDVDAAEPPPRVSQELPCSHDLPS
jgi:hypothetical protein